MGAMVEITMPAEALSMPVPRVELISRVSGGPDVASFFWSGRESVRELRRTLAIADRELESFESILDFGCGCGRMLLWLEELGRARELHGTDIDAEAVAWCQAHTPYAKIGLNGAEPPLRYPDGAFDLVFNHSVFTHIDRSRQDVWLSELHRVTRPGALLVLSTHGETAIPDGAGELRNRLERDGIAFIDNSVSRELSLPAWYQTTFHAPWYVFEHWARWFAIRGYVPGGDLGYQDQVLLERRTDHAPGVTPLRARPPITERGLAEHRVATALAESRANRATAAGRSSRPGSLGRLLRAVILRCLRPYTAHEDRFDEAVAASITELARATDYHSTQLEALSHLAPPRTDLDAASPPSLEQ